MSAASPQVQSRETHRIEHTSADFFDGTGTERIIDMMHTGMSSPERLRHLEVITEREFEYDTIPDEVTGIDNPGRSMAYEAFMQEPVVVMINETNDDRASPVVFVGVNGDTRWLPRGVPIRLPRKFVERLAQSQERTFRTPKINATEEADNERPVRSKQAQSYGFSIIHDSHKDKKLARRWLLRVTKQST